MANANLGRADIDVRAELSRLDRDLKQAEQKTRRATGAMQRDADRANQRLGRMGTGLRQNMDTVDRSLGRVNRSLGETERLAAGVVAAIGGAAGARAIIDMADEYTSLAARIRLVVREGEQFADVQDDIFRAAQRSRAPINDLTTLYVRLRQSMADLGNAEALNISETLARSLVISGASATEQAGFLRQISQALASGVLRGDEFNSVMENNSRFARMLADYLGVSVGQLRAMAQEGKLTADIIRGAVAGGAAQINSEFERMPLTVGGAMTQLRNAMAKYVGETDTGLGATRRLAEGLSSLASNFQTVADAVLLLGGAAALSFGGRGIQGAMRSAAREVRRWDAPYRARRFGLQRQRLEAAGVVAAGADDTARREAAISAAEKRIAAERAAIANIRQAQARRMFNVDGAEIERALRERRAPILRPITQAQGPVPIPGAVRGGQAAEADNLAAAQRRLAEAEKDLQRIRGENYRAAMRDVQARNRLVWATSQVNAQNSLLAQSIRGVQAAGVGLRRFFGSLFNFLGGPWGVALAAAAGAWMIFRSEQDKAAASAARMQDALSIIANARPAFEGAADAIGETASETRTMADLADQAADATDRLRRSQERASQATRDQTEATRALNEIRRRDAADTIRQAIADERRRLFRLENYTAGEMAADFFTGEFIGDRKGRRNPGQDAIDEARAYIEILERGLANIESGMLDINGGGDVGAGAGAIGGPNEIRNLRLRAELTLAQIQRDYERVAALEDALSLEQKAAAYVNAGMRDAEARATAEREVAAERAATIAAQQESLRLSGLQEQADIARAREAHNTADALDDELETQRRIEQLRAEGLGEEAAIERANEYVRAMRAATNAAKERAEAEDALDRALEIAGAEGHNRRTRELEREVEIARGAQRYRGYGYGDASEAMAAADYDRLQAARARGELRAATEDALWAAASGGNWKQAFADSIRDAAREGFSRLYDYLYDAVFRAFSDASQRASKGGSSTSFWGQVVGAIFGMGGGGGGGAGAASGGGTGSSLGGSMGTRANGGPTKALTPYKIAEIGTEPVFFSNKPANVLSNKEMRDAMSRNTAARQKVELEVFAKTDGSVMLEIQAAEQRATVRGAQLGANMVSKSMNAQKSK